MVPNPYILISQLGPYLTWCTVVDLKDAFFCVPLAPVSQPPFALQWQHRQFCWAVLPQGFKNSPIFGKVLAKDLATWQPVEDTTAVVLQYVDNLLLAAPSVGDWLLNSISLLNSLCRWGCKVSRAKAQLVQSEVR